MIGALDRSGGGPSRKFQIRAEFFVRIADAPFVFASVKRAVRLLGAVPSCSLRYFVFKKIFKKK